MATCLPASGSTFPLGDATVTCNATDVHGNAATPTTFVVHVVDTTAPTTSKTILDQDSDGALDSVTLSATDTVTGVASISFSIDGAPLTTVAGATTTFTVPAGTHTLSYFATDGAGNNEPTHTQTHTFTDQCPGTAGTIGNTGCPFADKNIVTLHTVNLGGSTSTKAPLAGALVRVFDRNDPNFQAVAGSKNPDGSLYGVIYEADAGRIATCTTDSNGICFAGETQIGDYLVIVKYDDSATSKTVYVGRPKSPSDFVDTNGDGTGDLATKDFQVMKVLKNGVLQGYRGGSKMVVTGSILEMIVPESAVWEGTQSIYPFIFTSDSTWSINVCAQVPAGYSIVGVYNENGELIATRECVQTLVANELKIVAFEVVETSSPEPSLSATLTVKSPKGKTTVQQVTASDIRKKSFDAAVGEAKGKATPKPK